jgi:hypothetical protein
MRISLGSAHRVARRRPHDLLLLLLRQRLTPSRAQSGRRTSAVPVLAWLSGYAFHSATQPSPIVGFLAAGGTIAAVVLQLHLAVYRVSADAQGISEKTLFATRRVS